MKFAKMNGCGNAFAIFDVRARGGALYLAPEQVKAIATPERGSGCDQIMAIEQSEAPADAFMRIWNAGGEEVSACGNGTRAVAWLLMQEAASDQVCIRTNAGLLHAHRAGDHLVCVDMGPPKLDWNEIPLAERMDTRGIDIKVGPIDAPVLSLPGAVNMGNPHAVFFVEDVASIEVETLGAMLEHHPLFPLAANIGFAEVRAKDEIRLRVWERGAGLTKACGTGACAALVACHRRGLTGRHAKLILDGGELLIEWREADNHILMTGPVELEYEGEMEGL
ncbi:MAG: diaminopimelate epimerase [Robiginitomaculum sp.]|nr:diaminopimelate epimerase [Robiginitomaculum sp.]MDQ7076469.1 diaminopimelate epimerase [Robiginitomaculum sp.]